MRIAADPEFTFKLAAECCIDAAIIVTVNLLARRQKFFTELEFVLSQVKSSFPFQMSLQSTCMSCKTTA